jgi:hypothetical protein
MKLMHRNGVRSYQRKLQQVVERHDVHLASCNVSSHFECMPANLGTASRMDLAGSKVQQFGLRWHPLLL